MTWKFAIKEDIYRNKYLTKTFEKINPFNNNFLNQRNQKRHEEKEW